MLRSRFVTALLTATLACCEGPLPNTEPPASLYETGLYGARGTAALGPGVDPFAPRFAFWADGADKSRWVRLPPGAQISAADMDHWSVPVGTRLWKELRIGGKRVETRMITRHGPGPDDFSYAAYRWNRAGTDADYVPDGGFDAVGKDHPIPSAQDCHQCHDRVREHVLGFGAVQLNHEGPGLTLNSLARSGRLAAPGRTSFAVPGDAATQRALGYLHANCGTCHNPDGIRLARPFNLRLATTDASVAQTGAYQTAVGVAPGSGACAPGSHRISAASPAASCIVQRMSQRGSGAQMPPLASQKVDAAGVAAVSAWISVLRP